MRFFIGFLCGLAFSTNAALGQSDELQLVLDTGGHMAVIRDIAFTPDGRQLVSASQDKTIRVWDLATGRTVRTIRGEIAPGNPGKIYAMALSPDGKWLAAGGVLATFDGSNHREIGTIRLYDFASGKLVALLTGHKNVVNDLAFSPDGQQLISAGADYTAIIWDVNKRQLLHRLKGHQDRIFAVGFTPDGVRAVTGSDDHDLRLWRVADGSQIGRMSGHGDKVISLAVAPDGTIASGDLSGEIRLWDGKTGAFRKVLVRQNRSAKLSFAPDGKRLLSSAGGGSGPRISHVYDVASGREIVTYSRHDNTVTAIAISPDGRWAATAGGNKRKIHLWDPRTGERRPGPDEQPLTLGGQGRVVWAVSTSDDSRHIGWGNVDACPQKPSCPNKHDFLQYAMTLPGAQGPLPSPRALGAGEVNRFRHAMTKQGSWSIRHRKKDAYGYDAILDIKQGGKVVSSIERGSTDGYGHSSYSFTPDGETIISGGQGGWLSAYDRAGKKLGDFVGQEGVVWAVAPSPDGRFLVSGAGDQTVRLWNLKTRELLVTLFYGADGEWVMWTPGGYYVSSPGGEDLIGWHVNRGPENAADFFPVGQFRDQYYRPDIVALTVELGDEARAVARANEEANRREAEAVGQQLPPVITITSPADGGRFASQTISIAYSLRSPSGLPVTRVRALIDGRPIEGAETKGFVPVRADAETSGQLRVAVPARDVKLSLIAETGRAASPPATIRLTWGLRRASGANLKGELDLMLFVNELKSAQNGVVVLASSDGTELSQERDEWRNGAFTEALLEGMDGKADLVGNDGIVHIDELGLYVKERVKALTGGQQHPVDTRPQETRNIPFARAKR